MYSVSNDGCVLNVRVDGPESGYPVFFANSLGSDLRIWDRLIEDMPDTLRLIRYDKRGHGLSDCPPAPYEIATLVSDAACVADFVGIKGATFVGLSIGGLIGQGLALSRPDLVSKLVLMDTAAKIGSPEMWQDRIAALQSGGIASIADAILDRWFAPGLRNDPIRLAPWRNMLVRTPLDGYIGCCAAISGADFTADLSKLSLPVMAMAGAEDQSTPPALVQATADLLGAAFHELPDAGHLPCIEQPEAVARLIIEFIQESTDA